MNDLNEAILKSANDSSHGSGTEYKFTKESILEFAKSMMLDAIHDNSLHKQLFEVK